MADAKKYGIDRALDGPLTGLAFEHAFAGAPSFLKRRYARDAAGADLAVLGVPFDAAVSHRPGPRFGPRAIREASALQPCDPPWGWPYDPYEELRVVDAGDVGFDYAAVHDVPQRIQVRVAELLGQGAGTLVLGGDHFVTLPILRAYAQAHGPLAVLQFDAHSDLWPDDDPSRIDHGTFLYKAVREELVDVPRSMQVGIRTESGDRLGVPMISAREVHERGVASVVEEVRRTVGDAPCYVTFDIDALDPSAAPGTGTPVWGGLHAWQAQAILRDLAGLRVLGGDVVEVSPPYDHGGITAVAGAHVATEIMCLFGWHRLGKGAP